MKKGRTFVVPIETVPFGCLDIHRPIYRTYSCFQYFFFKGVVSFGEDNGYVLFSYPYVKL